LGGELDLEVLLRQIEIRRDALQDPALGIPLQGEGRRLRRPANFIKIQQLGELRLTGVGLSWPSRDLQRRHGMQRILEALRRQLLF
jgi:hypothetical protein